jgi:hypothetical protein
VIVGLSSRTRLLKALLYSQSVSFDFDLNIDLVSELSKIKVPIPLLELAKILLRKKS